MASKIVEFSSSHSCTFNWRIENFSKLNSHEGHYSDVFYVGSFKWIAEIYPKGYSRVFDHLSLFLSPVHLPKSVDTEFSFSVISQINQNKNVKSGIKKIFTNTEFFSWGWKNFMGLSELHDPDKGYLVKDTCIVKVEVTCRMMDEDTKYEGDASEEDSEDEYQGDVYPEGTRNIRECIYPGAGKPFGEGQHDISVGLCKDKEFEAVGGFSILKTQVPLYKQIWLKYGHIPSTNIMPIASYPTLVMVVKDLMCSIIDMQKCHYVDLSPEMINRWEDHITMAEKFEFEVRWLRERFEDVKKGMCGMQNVKTALVEHGLNLRSTKSKMRVLRNVMAKVEAELIASKDDVREKISGLLSESDMETYLDIGEDLLLEGVLDEVSSS